MSKASAISLILDIPVDKKIGLPLEAMYLISGKSVNSNEATLKAGTFKLKSKSTAVSSNGVENIKISCDFANLTDYFTIISINFLATALFGSNLDISSNHICWDISKRKKVSF